MQSLLRTRPENLDDLTVQVALVRPGPIQGGAVHPYIERRQRRRENPDLRAARTTTRCSPSRLRETLGVVVFQEQVLEVAMALAGFTRGRGGGPAARDEPQAQPRGDRGLPAALPRRRGGERRRPRETAEDVFAKLLGFASFGFPKSHAAAFALLAYQSAWLRHHYPAEFLCALLNAQPMGFYPPASLVRDAQRRGIEVLPPDVNASDAACRLEGDAVRVGLAYVKGVAEEPATALVEERERAAPFRERSGPRAARRRSTGRRSTRWPPPAPATRSAGRAGSSSGDSASLRARCAVGAGGDDRQLALPLEPATEIPDLPEQSAWELMLADYRTTSLSVGVHPLDLLRPHLPARSSRAPTSASSAHRERVAVAGLVVARQRPATANGVVFMLLEDEHGQVNLIVPPPVYDRYRAVVRGEPLLLARGRFERVERNRNVVVEELATLAPLARRVANDAEVRASPCPRRTTSAPGSLSAHGSALALAAGGARCRAGSRAPRAPRDHPRRRLHRRGRLRGPLDLAPHSRAGARRVRRAARGRHLRRRPVRAKRRLRALLVAEDRDAGQAGRARGGVAPRARLGGRRRRPRRLLRAGGSRRALHPGRLALDGDLARAARLVAGCPGRRGGARRRALRLLSADEVRERTGSPIHLGAAYEPAAATVQPALLARGLRRVALARGVRVFERSPLLDLDRDAGVARTPTGAVEAPTIVLATGTWLAALRELQRAIVPVASDMVATEPMTGAPPRGRLDGRRGRLRLPPDGALLPHDEGRARRFRPRRRPACLRRASQLGIRLQRAPDASAPGGTPAPRPCTEGAPITHAWGGPIDRTTDGLPFFGQLPGRARVLFGAGFSGNGVAPSLTAGKILASSALGPERRVVGLRAQPRRGRPVPARARPLRRRPRRARGRASEGDS